jgi:hypothetical protein
MIYLKQSTASQEVLLGPFVDATDGVTAETGLTIANTDIKLWVAGATTLANKNSGGATHISAGNYYAVLDATDTATLGSGAIVVQVSGALAVRHPFVVLAANVYDALIGGGDLLDVNTSQLGGTSQTGRDIGASVLLSSGTGTGQVSLSSGRVLIQSGIQKGAALTKFQFLMTDSTDHNPATGLTVTGTVSKDGGSYATISPDSITEVANGMYEVDLSATEMNANNVSLRFTATGADDQNITIRTDP